MYRQYTKDVPQLLFSTIYITTTQETQQSRSRSKLPATTDGASHNTHNADQLVAHQHIYQTVRTHHWLQIITDILLLRKNKVTLRSVIGITVLP